jgi:DNA polymerase-1
MPAPLLLADIPWLLYRSFFTLPSSITDDDGRPVNALLGTVNALLSVIDGRLPARPCRGVVGCTGAENAEYRVALYPGYHAQREPMPEALAEQWTRAPELLEGLGWTVASSEDLEADDVMFSLARTEEEAGGGALLLTGDRDLYGGVSERVAVIDLRKGGPEEVGPAEVNERYGIRPEQVADFIALRGDPSDGLPGAPGIGAKTAAELLRAYGTLEALLSAAGASEAAPSRAHTRARASQSIQTPPNPPEPIPTPPKPSEPLPTPPTLREPIRARTAATLREHAELLRTFREIATLQRIDLERPADNATDFTGGAQTAERLGMKRLAKRLRERAEGAA